MSDTKKKRALTSATLALLIASLATPSMAQSARQRNLQAPNFNNSQEQIIPAPGGSYLHNGYECMTDPDGRGHFVPCSGGGGA